MNNLTEGAAADGALLDLSIRLYEVFSVVEEDGSQLRSSQKTGHNA